MPKCPRCGEDARCASCGYSEPDIWMQGRHDFETQVALADNVKEQMPELWDALQHHLNEALEVVPLKVGVYIYKVTNPTPNAPSGRVIRILVSIYKARGNTFNRPKNYAQRRDSDKKSLAGWHSSHRTQESKRARVAKGNRKLTELLPCS